MDAGADTTTAVRVMAADGSGRVVFHGTPLAFTCSLLAGKVLKQKDATESQLHSLEATRRLLVRVEAAHAVSSLWASDPPSTTHSATEGSDGATRPTPLISMLPILRRRARSPGVLVAALLRWVTVSRFKDRARRAFLVLSGCLMWTTGHARVLSCQCHDYYVVRCPVSPSVFSFSAIYCHSSSWLAIPFSQTRGHARRRHSPK